MQSRFILLSLFIISYSVMLMCSSWGMESDSDSASDSSETIRMQWLEKVKDAEMFLDSLDVLQLEEEDYCGQTEGYFFTLLEAYKHSGGTSVEGRKVEVASKLRTYEVILSPHYNREKFKPEDLWDSALELEYLDINNMKQLTEAIQRGADTPPPWVFDLIQNGGSTSFQLNYHLPPKFFRLPSNFEGERFLIGGERLNPGDQQETYMLNFDRSKFPDILAKADDAAAYVCIPTGKFSTIEFDFIDNRVLHNFPVLQECVRVMNPLGVFIFRTQHDSQASYRKIKGDGEIDKVKSYLESLYNDVTVEFKADKEWATNSQKYFYNFVAKNPKHQTYF